MPNMMIPSAPEPQNRMMTPSGGPPMSQPGQQSMGPNAMQAAPAAPAMPPTQDQVDEARTHIGAVVDGLIKAASKPRGELTKKDVFDAASDMIANGAFPTPASKQELIVHLAKMPDDEQGLRKAIGQFLLQTSAVRSQFMKTHGEG